MSFMNAPPGSSGTCCIAGGGPARMMLGYLLARAGIEVLILEKHADFLRDFRVQLPLRFLAHQCQVLLDRIVGDEAQEGRLCKLDHQSLAESVVKHSIARCVREIGEHNCIPFIELGCLRRTSARQTETKDDRTQQSQHDDAYRKYKL